MGSEGRVFGAFVRRRAIPIATILLFAGSLGSSEAICRADCEAASRSAHLERAAPRAACHEASEKPSPWPECSPDCARHSRDCSLTAGGSGTPLSGPRSASRTFAIPTAALGPFPSAPSPFGFAPARARPRDASPPDLSSVLRL